MTQTHSSEQKTGHIDDTWKTEAFVGKINHAGRFDHTGTCDL